MRFKAWHRGRYLGGLAAPFAMLLVLVSTLLIVFLNRPLIAEQRASTNAYHSVRATEAASGGLAWILANLNGPKPAGQVCAASGQMSWKAACEWTEQGGLACDCGAPGRGDEVRSGLGFQVTVSRVIGDTSRLNAKLTLDVSVTGCSVTTVRGVEGRCSVAKGAIFAALKTRLRFVPLLAHLPSAALTAGGTISAPIPTGAAEPAWGGYVMGAYLSTPPLHVVAETLPPPTGAREASPRDNVPAVGLAAFRDAAFRLTCDGDCSGPIHRAVQLGHTVIWVDGDLSLASDLTLGDDEHPVLLWVTGDVALASQVSVTGLLLSRSVVWRAATGREAHFKGAMVVDGTINVTGSPSIEWAPEVLDRLAATSGWFEPVPRWHGVK